MKKTIIVSLVLAALVVAPHAAVFANQSPAYDPSTSPQTSPQVSKPIVDPAPRAECLAINEKNLGIGSRDAVTAEKYNTPVKALQTLLQENGFFDLNPTGYFGSITSASVKAFQKKYGVPATGYFGPLTRAKIVAEFCKLVPVDTSPQTNSSISVVSPQLGNAWARDTIKQIVWTDKNVYIQAQKYDITLSPKSPCVANQPCTLMLVKPYSIATSTFLTTDGYAWKVGTTLDADRTIPDGEYTINVCPTGAAANCAQSGLFTIGTLEPIATSTITQMAPNTGPIGTKVRIATTFFNEVNHINFGSGYIPKSAITTGNGYIEFNVPNQIAPACYYSEPVHCMIAAVITPPNTYWVSLTLNNGNNTNKFPFKVTAQ